MCAICGCGSGLDHDHSHGASEHGHHHDHAHSHDHGHDHAHDHGTSRIARFELDLLAKNDRLAARNRRWLEDRGILGLNVMGSPGAGKTALLEQTAARLRTRIPLSVLEGDQATEADAIRIRAAGCKAVQINTGAGCHLDADMVEIGLRRLEPEPRSILFLENVGNLVCPALFDLGEARRLVVLSVTEGEDKPLKYPHVFRSADVLVLSKVDLLPHLRFDVDRCLDNARQVKPGLRTFRISATTGEGVDEWCEWLVHERGRS
ncbi:hydrogenase nickel incorporation protein HypB [Vulgatibacter incomptus]|uniref:[NiFe] hydrogenase nickel incorporation-associated protein HypB n=1 Tax=Vulgatibacter incomptus TaxID=1391653 RepID=A0A0K1P9D4_9BACT|nr:hydrogenase nickel incorporation protein HypB [Vulgatibacter incomptus]AKU90148.1 [NiFe] hydrogenase nickel incorporation-associated protein HypB [Vulgatibacter incomptus]